MLDEFSRNIIKKSSDRDPYAEHIANLTSLIARQRPSGDLPSPYAPSSLGKAAVGDIKEFAWGMAALASSVLKGGIDVVYDTQEDKFRFSSDPLVKGVPDFLKGAASAIKSDFQEYLEDPAGKFARDPLFFLMDVGTLGTVGLGLAAKGAKAARVTSLATVLESASTPAKVANLAINPLRLNIPLFDEALRNLETKRALGKEVAKTRRRLRIESMQEVRNWTDAFRKLTIDEKDLFNDLIERTALPRDVIDGIQLRGGSIEHLKVMPDDIPLHVREVVDKWKKAAREEREYLIQQEYGTLESLEEAVYKPLSGYTGLSVNEIKESLGTLVPEYLPHYLEKRVKFGIFSILMPIRHYESPTFLKRRTTGTGRLIDPNDARIGKPITDPEKLILFHRLERLKWIHNNDLVKRIENIYGKRVTNLEQINDVLNNGIEYTYKIGNRDKSIRVPAKLWYSHGYLRFYKHTVDAEEVLGKLIENIPDKEKFVALGGNLQSVLEDALESIMPDLLTSARSLKPEQILAVSKKVPVYAVPEPIAEIINRYWAPQGRGSLAQIALAYDTSTDLLRFMWLSSSPRWLVNNTAGNMTVALLSGISPVSFFRSFQRKYRDLVPEEITPGIFAGELDGRFLGNLSESRTGVVVQAMTDIFTNTPILNTFGKVSHLYRRVNEQIEGYFRSALYIDRASKLKQMAHMSNAAVGIAVTEDLADKLRFIKDSPQLVDHLLDEVNKWYFDYFSMSPFERRVLRRIIPFWNWIKNINRLVYSLPWEHPARGELLSTISRATNDITNQDEIPPEIRGSVALDRMIRLRGGGLAALSDILVPAASGVPKLGLHPIFDYIVELATGTDPFTWRRIQRSDSVIDFITGQVFQYDPNKKDLIRVDKITPSLPEHIADQIPHLPAIDGFMEFIQQRVFDKKPIPIKTNIGYIYPPSPLLKVFQMFGIPTSPAPLGDWQKREREALKRARTVFTNRLRMREAIDQEDDKVVHKALGGNVEQLLKSTRRFKREYLEGLVP